ncbi:DUF1722 domain-containing protein [Nitrospira sp. Nam80]
MQFAMMAAISGTVGRRTCLGDADPFHGGAQSQGHDPQACQRAQSSCYFKSRLLSAERAELEDIIADYHHGLVPLMVPLTLVKHYVAVYET